MCSSDLEKELAAQQHLFLDYAQVKAHIVTVSNSRTRGLVPLMMGNLSDGDSNHHVSGDETVESKDRELYRLEIDMGSFEVLQTTVRWMVMNPHMKPQI